jgi:hypothetical protein
MYPRKYKNRKALSWSELVDVRKSVGRGQRLVQYEDKLASKKIAEKAGCYIPKTYFSGKDPAKIKFDELPETYVIKPNHLAAAKQVFLMSNGVDQFNNKKRTPAEIIEKQSQYLKKRINPAFREWATGQIPRRTIVEEYIKPTSEDPNSIDNPDNLIPTDYKCYLFHGRVALVRMDYGRRQKDQATDYYTRDFKLVTCDPVRTKYPRRYRVADKPVQYDRMIELVEKMGKDFGKFIRIDMYLSLTDVIFGEFTLYPGSGSGSKFTLKTDAYMGALWQNKKYIDDSPESECFTEEHFNYVISQIPKQDLKIILTPKITKTQSKSTGTQSKSTGTQSKSTGTQSKSTGTKSEPVLSNSRRRLQPRAQKLTKKKRSTGSRIKMRSQSTRVPRRNSQKAKAEIKANSNSPSRSTDSSNAPVPSVSSEPPTVSLFN